MNKYAKNFKAVNLKIKLTALLMCLTSSAFAADSQTAEQANYLAESRKTAQAFMQTLGGTLKKQLEAGGAESAIGVCKQIAPALAAEYSQNGRTVKRVSLKMRNAVQGTPDAWEKTVLENFDAEQQQGKSVAEMEVTKVSTTADGRAFRYMKAIPAQPLCLQCHGQPADISAGVRALLSKEYPLDQAVGYRAGQIRGAISISYSLADEAPVSQ